MKTIEIDECIKRVRSYAMQFEAEGKKNISEDLWVAVDFLKRQTTMCFDCTQREWYMRGYQDGLNADKWIPCEERLPSEKGFYLVTVKRGCNLEVLCIWNQKECWLCDQEEIGKIIAWTFLPQPYKKEGAENE